MGFQISMYSKRKRSPNHMDLVTGGAGFIGSHLVDALVTRGSKVRVLDNFSSGRESFLSHHDGSGEVEIYKGDLLDTEAVLSAMDGIETVHHLAANPDIRLGTEVTDTDLKQGTIATYNVLEAMRVSGVKRISFSSTSAIYGEATEMPTSETYGPTLPISLYGASKLACEALITAWIWGTRLHPPFREYRRPKRDSWGDIRFHSQTEERSNASRSSRKWKAREVIHVCSRLREINAPRPRK